MTDPSTHYSADHWGRLAEEVARDLAEVPAYRDRGTPPGAARDARELAAWLSAQPLIGKKELRRGFPKSLLRGSQDLNAAMGAGQVTLLATSGTTADRLQVIWEWSWWDPQERECMRLNARVAAALARATFREAVLTTPACGGGACHIGVQTREERTLDGMLFFNQTPDPSHWTDAECARMLAEWRDFSPRGVEADPAYLAQLARFAKKSLAASGAPLPAPEFVTLTYETTTRAHRRDIGAAIDAPLFQLYGATEAGALFMECERNRLHANHRHAHVELLPWGDPRERLAKVVLTTLGREWMPLLRYEIGDVVRVASEARCACGLEPNGPLLERMEGRASDCVAIGDRGVTPAMLDDAIFAAAPRHAQWQLNPGAGVLSVVGEGASEAAAAAGKLLGRPIRAQGCAAIAPEASGKYRLVRG